MLGGVSEYGKVECLWGMNSMGLGFSARGKEDGWTNRDNLRGCVCWGIYICNYGILRTRHLIRDTS